MLFKLVIIVYIWYWEFRYEMLFSRRIFYFYKGRFIDEVLFKKFYFKLFKDFSCYKMG